MLEDTITITVSDKSSIDWIRKKVRDGQFASETEAISEGISRLREDDSELERWIQDVIIPRYQRYKANPGTLIPLEEVKRQFEERWNTSSEEPR